MPEYAFIGRSNVGKSSLINMLTGQSKLAKTSSTPGKTQLINHFEVKARTLDTQDIQYFYIADLPGYGFAKVSQSQRRQWQQMTEKYLCNRENLMTVFVLIDSRHKPQEIDLNFLKKLGEWQVPFNVVFTKADKTNQREVAANTRMFIETMKEDWEFIPAHFITSSVKFMGRKKMLTFIRELNEEFSTPR
jgi:GTP-binding protein